MTVISFLFGLMTLLSTVLGVAVFLTQKLKVHLCFLPILTICTITLTMFLSGLVNALELGVVALTISATTYLIVYLKKIEKIKIHPSTLSTHYLTPGTLFFLLISVYFIILLYGFTFYAYDDFTHWAVIWKEMVRLDSFPDSRTVVTYQNYPPATAIWSYFVCYFLGNQEWTAMIAQSFIISASLTTLFCNTKKSDFHKIMVLSLAVFVCFFCILSEQRFSLNVDGILGYTTVALFTILYFHRNNFSQAFIQTTPLFLFLLLTKDSGKFFLAMGLILLCFIGIHEIKEQKKSTGNLAVVKQNTFKMLQNAGILLGLIFLADYLWGQYVEKAYPVATYEANKFEYSSVAGGVAAKSEEFMASLPTLFANSFFDFRYFHTYLFFAIVAISFLVLLLFAIKGEKVQKLWFSTIFLLGMTGIYLLGLYIMYATVMTVSEHPDNYVVAFDRYFSTMIMIFFLMQLFMFLEHLPSFEKFEKLYPTILSTLVVFTMVTLPFWGRNTFAHPQTDFRLRDATLIAFFDEVREVVPREKNILFSFEEYDVGTSVYYHVARYEIGASYDSFVIDDSGFDCSREELLEKLQAFEYILIYDNMEIVRETMRIHDIPFYYQEGVSVYSIVEDQGTIFLYPCVPE